MSFYYRNPVRTIQKSLPFKCFLCLYLNSLFLFTFSDQNFFRVQYNNKMKRGQFKVEHNESENE